MRNFQTKKVLQGSLYFLALKTAGIFTSYADLFFEPSILPAGNFPDMSDLRPTVLFYLGRRRNSFDSCFFDKPIFPVNSGSGLGRDIFLQCFGRLQRIFTHIHVRTPN